ncbi:hypothetical protein KRX52_06345 [Pseudomonas sp. MAP12]|uniref:Uncharacterized protein n=1 Tax=Geopseudomonas aromaticivorans TaxID=2849492 RepID=A0ABS6MVX6_9GAMM|nr:hypothetical protein [Pseudomonas aromaticivorans]MBV2132422.1 hypothetical protein [Pseudomonas aromaticivorans]
MLPKDPLARLLCKLGLLPLAWFAFLFWFENFAIWGTRASIDSPTGGTTAHLMSLIHESSKPGHAPYGLHVFLAPAWQPLPQRFGELAFAGYCKGDATIAWQAADRLVIRCETRKIVTPPNSRRGIHVELDSRPRSSPLHPQGNGSAR